jgi:hypothetical protein
VVVDGELLNGFVVDGAQVALRVYQVCAVGAAGQLSARFAVADTLRPRQRIFWGL